MNVQQYRAKSRIRSRQDATPVAKLASVHDGLLAITAFNVPGVTISTNGTVDVSVTVSNFFNVVAGANPDCCGPVCGVPFSGSLFNGISTEIRVVPEWTSPKSKSDCIGTTEVGSVDKTFEFSFEAPGQPGSYSLTAQLIVSQDDDSTTEQVQIGVGGDPRPDPYDCTRDTDCGQNQKCQDGKCVPVEDSGDDSGGGGPFGENLLMTLAIIGVTLVIAQETGVLDDIRNLGDGGGGGRGGGRSPGGAIDLGGGS